ncbi:RluA family pseudouridine synthase [Alicyclobacillaceae bacterium I2511]|nr:RluA family pseudouridine synthase [Alicyclobacillaceae bacterium I2511]
MVRERNIRVSESGTLLPFLLAHLAGTGRNKVKALLTHHQVRVDGQVVTRHDHPLQPGQRVSIANSDGPVRDNLQGVEILFEDADLLVIHKPGGLLSMANDNEREKTAYHALTDFVRQQSPNQRVFIVHRLDKETSGVMVFARSQAVQQALQEAWKDAVVKRAYSAVVEGWVTPQTGTLKSWLKESRTQTMYVSPQQGDGQLAITHYQVVQANRNFSLLDVRLQTGRKNQIRVHMQSIGHPVAGDNRYGAHSNPIGRLALHARLLVLRHPVDGQILEFETPVPKSFLRVTSSGRDL